MNRIMGLLAIIIMGYGVHLRAAYENAYYDEPSDYAIINKIHQQSDITQADVDKIKLILLGRAQGLAAAGLGTAAAGLGAFSSYKAETMAYPFMEKLGEYRPTETNKVWWALAGALGIGLGAYGLGRGAYKSVYPRTQEGIVAQVSAYVTMCKNLEIVQYYYQTPYNLNTLGSTPGNSAWAGSNIARKKGIDDLLEQGSFALALLDQLENTEEVQTLRREVMDIRSRLKNNLPLIQFEANKELQQRESYMTRNVAGAQQLANLKLEKEKTSALKVGKISLAVTTLGNFIQRSMETMVYAYEHRGEITAVIAAGSISVYALLSYVQSKLGSK